MKRNFIWHFKPWFALNLKLGTQLWYQTSINGEKVSQVFMLGYSVDVDDASRRYYFCTILWLHFGVCFY
jgi:hypothetical protein